MKENTIVLSLIGTDFWSRPVYKVGETETFVKDINCGKGSPDLYWSYPKDNRDGEPDVPFRTDKEVLFSKVPHDEKTLEDKKFIIAKMIAANEYKDGVTSVEWLDLASGIKDIDLTRKLLADLKENPLEVMFDSMNGWIKKGSSLTDKIQSAESRVAFKQSNPVQPVKAPER